ncbi:ABC transporter permease family protein [Microbacterium aurum]|nr:hypothetical protein [Microbacterium aurum]MBM7826622.1 hypothetical protein [Microbacterium aurum]
MRPLAILREGLRGIGARPVQFISATLILGVALAGVGAAEAVITGRSLATMEAEKAKGSTVVIVDRNEGDIDGARCLRLGSSAGVTAVGTVARVETVGVLGYPSVPFQHAVVTPGLIGILYPSLQVRQNVTGIAGEAVADEVGLVDGSEVKTTGGSTLVLQLPDEGTPRSQDRARWLYTFESTPTRVRECWVEATPGSVERVREVIAATFSETRDLRVRSQASTATYDATRASWLARPTQFAWTGGALIGAAIAFTLTFTRRHELALYRLLGASKSETALIGVVATCASIFIATILGAEICAVAMRLVGVSERLANQLGLMQIALSSSAAYVIAIAACVLAASGNTTAMIRNRN